MDGFIRIINDFHNKDKVKSILPDLDARTITVLFNDGTEKHYEDPNRAIFNSLE